MIRRVLDVSGTPTVAVGPKDQLWWAMMLLNVIEGSMLVLLAISYVYIGDRTSPWPPVVSPRSIGWLGTVETAVLVASAVPIYLSGRGAVRGDLWAMRRWLMVGTAIGVVALVCRIAVFRMLPFRWDTNAYGGAVWTFLGLQTFHLLSSLVENTVFALLLVRGPVEEKHRSDLHASTLLWYLVVAGSVLVWAFIYVDILRTGVGP